MRRLFLAFLVCLASPLSALAADVTGSVVDESGGVLPGATVTLSGSGGTFSGVTRGDGKFSIASVAPGSYKVTVTMSGFSSASRDAVDVQASGADLGSFSLKIATLGETIVVSASKVESTITNAPATMSVIQSDAIQTSPAQNFGDLLRSVPGVNVIQMSARDINLASRKSTGTLETAQLVLLDGRSLYLDFFGLVLWDFVPNNPGDIKQIEVVRGPASAVWGANALSGVVNIITKSPREAVGTNLSLQAGSFNRDGGSRDGEDGTAFGASLSIARAPSDKLSYRLAGGYFDSDPYSRPVGRIPIIADPRLSNPVCNTATGVGPNCIGGALYPTDGTGTFGTSFENDGTQQPKVDLRVDQEFGGGARMTYNAGYAGSQGLVHTGIGPFRIESGSYTVYGKLGYSKNALRVTTFVNMFDAEAPNLLLLDPATARPVQLNFKTQTLDLEVGHSTVVAERHIFSYGGNARRNNFDITLTPNAKDRNEFGAYLQDEFHFGRFRLSLGGRVDKFGNIDKAVFSPRATAMFKPSEDQAFRVSFNKAFRSPSAVNNYLDQKIFAPVAPIDLRPLIQVLPLVVPGPQGQALASLVPRTPVNLIINNVGNPNLQEESVRAYEISYSGTFNKKTTVGLAWYQNDTNDNINFTTLLPSASNPQGIPPFDVYTPANSDQCCAPTGIPGPLYGFLTTAPAPLRIPLLPRTASTYLNLGPLRQRGFEVSLDHRFSNKLSAAANYSYQQKPEALDPEPGKLRYLNEELALPAKNRVNASLSWNTSRLIGSASVNYSDKALWTDVLTTQYHGFTDSYTMVNASIGVKWADGKVTTTLKGPNLLNEEIQQHVFGDILKRSVFLEARFSF
jgi:outer membrane receptor protein involved in Fe transport